MYAVFLLLSFNLNVCRVPLHKSNHTTPLLSPELRQQALEWKYRKLINPASGSPEPLVNYLDVRKYVTVVCDLAPFPLGELGDYKHHLDLKELEIYSFCIKLLHKK